MGRTNQIHTFNFFLFETEPEKNPSLPLLSCDPAFSQVMDASYKKRHRTPASCLMCRKRKSKCDRAHPVCGTCKRKLIAHLCLYEDETGAVPQNLATTYLPIRPHPEVIVPEPGLPMHPVAYPQQALKINSAYPAGFPPQLEQYGSGIPATQLHIPTTWVSAGPPPTYSYAYHLPQVWQDRPDLRKLKAHAFHYYQPRGSASSSSVDQRSPALLTNATNKLILPSLSLRPLLEADEVPPQTSNIVSYHNIRQKRHIIATGPQLALSGPHIIDPQSPASGPKIQDHETTPLESQQYPPSITFPSSHKRKYSECEQNTTINDEQKGYGEQKEYVSISFGNNVLDICVDDELTFFVCASNSLLVEGPYWQQQGLLSYVGLTKLDPYIKLVRSFTINLFQSEQFSKYTKKKRKKKSMSKSSSSANEENVLETEQTSPYSGNESEIGEIVNEDALIVTKIHVQKERPGQSSPTFPVAYLTGAQALLSANSTNEDIYKFAASSIEQILPRTRGINKALKRFFKYVHPFVPIFDEDTVTSELKKIICKKTDSADSQYSTVQITNDVELCIAGKLILMIRLGYMSLIPNFDRKADYSKDEKALIKDVTRFKSDDYMRVVNLCIPEERVQSRSTFHYVQALTLLHYYRSVAPNDCFGLSGSDSTLLFGSIVTHALSIGLNRDPTQLHSIGVISKEPSFVNSWRSLWYYICTMDAMLAIYCGMSLKLSNLDASDVEKPETDSLYISGVKFFEKQAEVYQCYRNFINIITNIRKKPKIYNLLKETSQMETLFLEMFGNNFFRENVCKPSPLYDLSNEDEETRRRKSYMKVIEFISFIQLRANLSCSYYLITLHYESKLDEDKDADISAGIELFKTFIRSVVQLVYIMTYALDNSQELFGSCYDFMLTSQLERCMVKTHAFLTSFFIRLVNYKKTLLMQELSTNETGSIPDGAAVEALHTRREAVDALFTIVVIEAELFVGNFRSLSTTYINSYKLYVMAYFVLRQCMENPENLFSGSVNSKQFFHEGANLIHFLSTAELRSLCKLCEEFKIAKVELMRRLKGHINTLKATTKEEKSEIEDASFTKHFTHPTKDCGFEGGLDFDATTANRAMYANKNTINTYGVLQEKHMHSEHEEDVFDEQSMIGNEELLKLFAMYGDFEAAMS